MFISHITPLMHNIKAIVTLPFEAIFNLTLILPTFRSGLGFISSYDTLVNGIR